MRRTTLAAGATVLIVGPTILAFVSGGYFDQPRLVGGVLATALVVLAAVAAPRPLPTSTAGRIAVAGLVLFAAWTTLSIGWAPIAGRAEDDAQRVILYAAVFMAAVALLDQPWVRRWLEPMLAAGTVTVIGYGLTERLLPSLVEFDRSRTSQGRLEQPLTYWNAEGAVAAIGLVLAIRIAGDPRRPLWLRRCAAAGGVVLALGMYLTFSRGAIAALALGLVVLLAFAPAGMEQLRAIGAVLAPALVAIVVTAFLPTVRSLKLGAEGDSGQGLVMLVVLVAMAAAAAVAVGRSLRASESRTVRLPVPRRRLVAGLAAITVLGGVAAIALLEGQPKTVSPTGHTDPSRLTSVDTNRYSYWGAAIDMFADRPLEGDGSGSFQVEWRKRVDRVDQASDAHSLYIETPAELGIVGLALLIAFLGGVAACGARLVRIDPAAAAGAVAGFSAWALHAGLDWDWEIPGVTLPALLLAAATVAWSERERHSAGERSGYATTDGTPASAASEPREAALARRPIC